MLLQAILGHGPARARALIGREIMAAFSRD